jgi:predicted RNase H-like HicB family nuclease
MKAKSKYTVKYTIDESGMWVAEVKGLPGCITQGRTIEQTRERVREAIQVFLDLPKPYEGELDGDVDLPAETKSVLVELGKVRLKKAQAEALERVKMQAAVKLLTQLMSLRDAGELVGVSRQRVHQLHGGAHVAKTRKKRVAAKVARG